MKTKYSEDPADKGSRDCSGIHSPNKGKYMKTADNGNDHRRVEDGPIGTKKHYLAWPGNK